MLQKKWLLDSKHPCSQYPLLVVTSLRSTPSSSTLQSSTLYNQRFNCLYNSILWLPIEDAHTHNVARHRQKLNDLAINAAGDARDQSFSSGAPANTIMRITERDQIRQPRNMNYEKDIRYVVKHSKWILNSVGVWPGVVRGAKRYLPNVAFGLSNSALLFAIVPCILHIVCEEKNIVIKLQLLGFLSFCVISLAKYWALTARKPQIKDCIEHVKDDWKQVSSSTLPIS